MLAVCCRGAGGNILHKPEMRQDSNSRIGRRDRACSHSLCLTQTRGRCRAADTCGINSGSAEQVLNQQLWRRKEKKSMGVFQLVMF